MCGGGISIGVIINDDRLMTEDCHRFQQLKATNSLNSKESQITLSYKANFRILLICVPTLLIILTKAHVASFGFL